jgi:hypothetical protein
MAEFKVNPRQVSTPQTDLPSTNVYGRLSQALGGLSNEIMGVATGINVEQQALQGAKDRMEGGPRETLAPGITKATQSYNQAFAEVDLNIVQTGAINQLSEDLIEARKIENLSQPGNVEKYKQTSEAVIKGALENSLAMNRPQMALKLSQLSANNMLELSDVQNKFDFAQARSQAAVANITSAEEIYNQQRDGNFEQAKELREETLTNIDAQISTGFLSEEEGYKLKKQLQQDSYNAEAEYVYRQLKEEDPAEAAKLLAKFATGDDEFKHLTASEREGVIRHLRAVDTQMDQAFSDAAQIGYQTVRNKMISSPTDFKTIEQLRNAFVQSSQNGYALSSKQQLDLEGAWYKLQAAANKSINNITEIDNNLDSINITNFSGKQMTDWFNYKVGKAKERRDEDVAKAPSEGQKIIENTPDWMIEAMVASESKLKTIPGFTDRISTRINKGTPEDKLNAVRAWGFLENTNPSALQDLSDTDRAFAYTVLSRMRNSQVAPEIIIQEATDSIINPDKAILEARKDALKARMKAKPALIDNLSKEIYSNKMEKMIGTPASIMKSAVQKEYEANFMAGTDDPEGLTIRNMQNKAAVSKFGPPNGVPMWNPVEKLPFYGFGRIVENQMVRSLQELVTLADKNPGVLPYELKWSDKMAKPPAKWTEEEKYKGKYSNLKKSAFFSLEETGTIKPDEFYLNINGKDRRVYCVSPTLNQTQLAGDTSPVYQLYFDDDYGTPRALLRVSHFDDGGTTRVGLTNTFIQFFGPDVDTPKILDRLQKGEAAEDIMEAAENMFNEKYPDTSIPGVDMPLGFQGRKNIKDNKEAFNKYIDSFRVDIKENVRKAQAKRAQQRLQDELE